MAGKTKVYAVIIEWMGQSPPTVWYDRIEALTGLRARSRKGKKGGGDADLESLLAGDNSNHFSDYGALAQEGAIICASYSLARTVAALATEGLWVSGGKGNPKVHITPDKVIISEMEVIDFHMTPEDAEALRRIEKVHGKRGRPAKDADSDFAVTCMEELASFDKEARGVANCPHCGGTQVRVRNGKRHAFADPGGPVWQAWIATRFAHGIFEIPAKGAELPPPTSRLTDKKESEIVARLISSSLVPEIEQIDRDDAFTILDALFVARTYWSKERRTDARLEALMAFFKRGGSPTDVELAEPENEFDWFDLAGPLGPEQALIYAMQNKEFLKV